MTVLSSASSFSSSLITFFLLFSSIITLTTSTSPTFIKFLNFSLQNLIYSSPSTPKPNFIITPTHASHIQDVVRCSKANGFQVRVRSGGHDYEGVSYVSDTPFVIVDLIHFRKVSVDVKDETSWVEAGATIGEVYYHISKHSDRHGFPAGVCPTVGVGGHISGGGMGFLMRKYGVAADNVLDAEIVDVNGKLLNRKSMGEDLFWAVRGGGGANFGVIVSWKIRLVRVLKVVTVFNVPIRLEEGATTLFFKWQNEAHRFHEDLFMRTIIQVKNPNANKTIEVLFNSIFFGTVEKLLPLMEKSFPELGLERINCMEMSWVNSTLHNAQLYGEPIEILLNRDHPKTYFKGKSDFVKKAISIADLDKIWKIMLDGDDKSPVLINDPFGGRMNEIAENEIPFPHRSDWKDGKKSPEYIDTIRRLHKYMGRHVSKSPRGAFLNYKDFDLGVNTDINGIGRYLKARNSWGAIYFKNNFERLAMVKNKVDPENFFWNQQSIPPLSSV
ncbi:hypothetical protein AQUCO_00800189v1 [Aquilegia coerulea]|uniref:FAD-binding PCMH-type domain-containing protein n=1 Tax=Aquilegia coerulea TaxID=218851 RepID=A0A2G5EHP6_AQUCA|nr:hypothetical protein AQUCO_00800189v1 [Aquilegia coerulea]